MHIQLTGNIGSVKDIRVLPNGNKVLDFSVAENERYTNSNGESVERTTWYNCSIWNEHATSLQPFLTTGRLVEIGASRIRTNAYTDKDGNAQASIELGNVEVKLLGGNPTNQRPAISETDIDKLLAQKLAELGITPAKKPANNQRKGSGKKSEQPEEAPRPSLPTPPANPADIPF